MNPDQIMPEDYTTEDFQDDLIRIIGPHIECINEKYPKYIGKIDWDKYETGKEIFVSNKIAEIRITDKKQELFIYLQNINM
jgi:hypothetical protein